VQNSVAVVILNYNGRDYLEKFLPSVIKYGQGHQIVVADNASTDSSVQFLKDNYPLLHLIELIKNTGYAGGYNNALKQIEADYFVLLNSDVEVTENWIDPVIEYMQADKQIIACQPKVKSYHKKDYFEYAGAAGGFIDYLGYPFCRGRVFSTLEKDEGQYDNSQEVFWATGACLFVKSKAFFELGMLDESFFAHMEEIDFCWRAKNQGFKIAYCAASTVYHVGGGTLQAESPFKTYLNFRNNLLMLYKNLNSSEFKAIYKLRRWLDFMAALQLFLQGKAKNSKAVYNAHRDFNSMKLKYQPTDKMGLVHSEIFSKSILREYFTKGKKKFMNLSFLSI